MTESLQKQIVGTIEPYGKKVAQGDFIFLYNYSDKKIYGIWEAQSAGGTYDTTVWKGKYKNQVKISQYSKVLMTVPRYALIWILGRGIRVGQILTGYKAQNLLQYFPHECVSEKELGINLDEAEVDYRKRYPTTFICEDGHRVRLVQQKIIDDWLYKNLIPHGYEPVIPLPIQLIPDFTVNCVDGNPVYIEYCGTSGETPLDTRHSYKSKLYAKYKLQLIELDSQDLHSVDMSLSSKLNKYGVSVH